MAKPTKPTVPAAPLRSEPSTFSARMEDSLVFWSTFATYVDESSDFVDVRADEALAAALGGDLPALTGKAGQLLRVNAGETAAEFTASINNTPIGGTTAAAGAFTTLAASGAATLASTLKIGATDPVAAAKQTFLTGGTIGGTADAVTLTTGLSLPALVAGMSARVLFTSANTSAMTLNVDGTGAVAIKTVTGADTPAGYIRTDVPTDLYYNGTNWIADRVVERGSGTGGKWTRWADGTQICAHGMNAGASWAYAKAFSATPHISGMAETTAGSARIITYASITTSAAYIDGWNLAGSAGTPVCTLQAVGTWY